MTPSAIGRLPPVCHAHHPLTGDVILILRGKPGYRVLDTAYTAEHLNSLLIPPPTPLQAKAMLVGSMFGWDVPAADPGTLRERDPGLS